MNPNENDSAGQAGEQAEPDAAGKLWSAYAARQGKVDTVRKIALAGVFLVFLAILAVGLWIIAVR
jgi:hypothetical protein